MKKTTAPSPEDSDLGAKLDRIIELLEQQKGSTTYVFPNYFRDGYAGPYRMPPVPWPSSPFVNSTTSNWTL